MVDVMRNGLQFEGAHMMKNAIKLCKLRREANIIEKRGRIYKRVVSVIE